MRVLARLAQLLTVQPSGAATFGGGVPTRAAVIYVDPCTADTHDMRLQCHEDACADHGVEFVTVWSQEFAGMLLQKSDTTEEEAAAYRAKLAPTPGCEAAWLEEALPECDEVLGVCCGSDAGLACAERLQHALAPARSNGMLRARRDKYEMHETLRAAGLDAARQAVATEWAEAERFLHGLPSPLRAVVKPRRGQASLRVGLARSDDEARRLFERVLELPASLDEDADASSVLLQEYLEGEEWVVDTVSRGGEHKVLALWRYDKGEANGAPFVYFGIEPTAAAGERALAVCGYAERALDALGWRWGPVHMEVMWVEGRGAVLVEANAGRLNGEEFKLLCDIVYGVSKYDAHFAWLLGADEPNNEAWDAIPARPPARLRCAGRLVKLVAPAAGTLRAVHHVEEVEALPSFAALRLASEIGEEMAQTVDLNSCAGDVVLLSADAAAVEADYQTLRQLQPTMFDVDEAAAAGREGGVPAQAPLAPAQKLQIETAETLRIARAVADNLPPAERLSVVARFPLVDGEFTLAVARGSAAARIGTESPRALGDALLRVLRTARHEEDAIAGCEALLHAVEGSGDDEEEG